MVSNHFIDHSANFFFLTELDSLQGLLEATSGHNVSQILKPNRVRVVSHPEAMTILPIKATALGSDSGRQEGHGLGLDDVVDLGLSGLGEGCTNEVTQLIEGEQDFRRVDLEIIQAVQALGESGWSAEMSTKILDDLRQSGTLQVR